MLIDFFYTLRDAKVPVTIREFLSLLEALRPATSSTVRWTIFIIWRA